MADLSIPQAVRWNAGLSAGSDGARLIACWLSLAAAPTFATMALGSFLFGNQLDMLCAAMQGPSRISGMTVMYLLMSAFHVAPWLRLISGRRKRRRAGLS